MRAGAQINKFSLLVERNMGIFRQVFNQLHFIGFSMFFDKFDGFTLGSSNREILNLP
jgi:hypothetical protein